MTDYRMRSKPESAEETLDRLGRAAEAAEIGTFYVPLPLGRLYWNARCKQHFWLPADTPDEVVDIDLFYRSIHSDDRERVRIAVETSVRRGVPYDVEYRTVSAFGEVRWLRAKGSTWFEAGHPVRFDGITIDVSTHKRLECERNALVESERMLRHAAQSSNEAKDAFIAAASHELRTPLTSILAWADLLIQRQDDPVFVKNGISVIRRNALTQTRLVDDLLDASRIGTGKFTVNKTVVALSDCLGAALQDLRPIADRRGVVVAEPFGDEVEVYGDGARLRQVFGNLLNNALKHTDRGGKIVPSLVVTDETVRVSIADTGAGIPPDRLKDIFEPFTQIETAVTPGAAGLGLGLSIARSIVVMHGGQITAESAGPGSGATFTVTLPLAGRRRSAERTPEKVLGGSSLAGRTVLLVEDDADTREALSTLLELEDATVVTASSVEQAGAMLERMMPDAILSDLTMPGEDGYSLVKRLRERGAGIPAIALSGHVRTEDRQRAREAGFIACLSKPVDQAELLAAMAAILLTSQTP